MQGSHSLLSYFTRHATAANLLLVILLALGVASYPRMRAQFFPDVVLETIVVTTSWVGAGAEDVDDAIVQVLEPALLAVEGVSDVNSLSFEGRAQIVIDFQPDWDVSRAADDVQTAIDDISTLPDEADDPVVTRGAWRDRITDVVISGPVGIEQLGQFADDMVIELFKKGVTKTNLSGIVAPETVIEVTTNSLIKNDISMSQIAAAVLGEVSSAPAGDVAAGASRVRSGVAKRSIEDIGAIVLRNNDDGSALRISDVATLRKNGIDSGQSYFVDDNPAIVLSISRSATGDAIAIQDTVDNLRTEMLLSLPDGVEIELVRKRSDLIKARLNMLLKNGIAGLALVALLLFLFLNARTAFWVAAGIPVAMMTALFLMYMAGLTINMISLFALIITLGIVVDDAIVVGEHADFRARELGERPVQAAENAAIRMFPPVLSATLTTIIAFFGLTIISGSFGNLIADIPFTVIVVLAASLVECFLIMPHHMAKSLTQAQSDHWYDWPSRQVNKGFAWVRDTLFHPVISWVIIGRYAVMACVILLFTIQIGSLIRGDLPFRFFSGPERSSVTGNFAMTSGTTREDTLRAMRYIQQKVRDTGEEFAEKYGENPVKHALAQTGGNAGRGLSGTENKDADQKGSIVIELIDGDLRSYDTSIFVAVLQENLGLPPMVEVLSFRGGRFGPGGDAIDIELSGADSSGLKSAAEALKTTLSNYQEVSALEDSLAYDKDELILELTPQGHALGFSADEIGSILRQKINGIDAASYPDGTRSAKIRVELAAIELGADFIDNIKIRTKLGNYVNLSDLVSVTTRTGFASIQRENGVRVINVTGDIDETDPNRAAEIQTSIVDEILPALATDHGISFRASGLAQQQAEFFADVRVGLSLVLLSIFLTLAWIFSSWTRPFVVMAIIPFGLLGAIYGHNQWDVPLSIFSIIGLIGMTGIIINDSIVLVTTIDEYAQKLPLRRAIVKATVDRLRPVMLTTLTTVFGLMPLLYEGSRQAEFLKPTVITLTYGLGFGVFLVLLIVPALIAMQSDMRNIISALPRLWRARRKTRAKPVVVLVSLAILLSAAGFLLALGLLGATMTSLFGATLFSATICTGLFFLAVIVRRRAS